MDINEYKKIAIPKIEAGKMVEIVRKAIKEEKYSQQDKYEEQKEVYKPIVETLEKEIDEISGLREEYVKSANKPIAYIQQQALPGVEPKYTPGSADLDEGFTENDKDILSSFGFLAPYKLFISSMADDKIVQKTFTDSGKWNSKLALERSKLSRTDQKRLKNENEIQKYDYNIELIKKYRDRIRIIEEGKKTLKQSGKGIYNQTKRNAYKINQTTGQYGNLKVDLAKLFGQLKMIVYKNGKKIYDNNVDFDTIDLFTKRYNSKKKYSNLSRMVFNDINKLAQIPVHRTSKKYKKIGSGVVYYNNPQDLLSRLELLGGSISAGNNGVKNELRKLNIINNEQFKNLFNKYVI